MTTALTLLILFVVLIGVLYYIPRFMVTRAIRQVIAVFRHHGALSPETATSLDSLGLAPKSAFDRMFRMRDYKPYATRLLMQAEIIWLTEDGLVFLSEEDLENSNVNRLLGSQGQAGRS